MDALRSGRVDRREPVMEDGDAVALSLGLERSAQGEVWLDLGHAPALQQRPDVLTGAADQDRALAARADLRDGGTSVASVAPVAQDDVVLAEAVTDADAGSTKADDVEAPAPVDKATASRVVSWLWRTARDERSVSADHRKP